MSVDRATSAFHPKNWGQDLAIATLFLIAHLPWRWAIALGAAFGSLAYTLLPQRRAIVRTNLELCFPELASGTREDWVRENFRYTGRGVAELALAWFGGPSVDEIPCRIEGMEHLRSAVASQRPVLLFSAHFTSIELAGRMLGRDLNLGGIYKPVSKRPVFDRIMRHSRARNLGAVVPREDIKGILRLLKKKTILWYAGDQHVRTTEKVFAPFFGIPAATTTGLARLARISEALVLPVFYNVADGGLSYEIRIGPCLEGFPSDDKLQDMTRMNAAIEEAVRKHPTQYFWVHRRFRKRPNKGRSPYERLRDKM